MEKTNNSNAELEASIEKHAQALLQTAQEQKKKTDRVGQFLSAVLSNDDLKIRTLRFVDTLPDLHSDHDLAEHLRVYFKDGELPFPGISSWMLKQKSGDKLMAVAIRKTFHKVAQHFLVGEDVTTALKTAEKLRKTNLAVSLDMLGEATLSNESASRYSHALIQAIIEAGKTINDWEVNSQLDLNGEQPIPRLNFSIKLTSLFPRPAAQDFKNQINVLSERLRPIFREARKANLSVTIDMENYDCKDLVFGTFKKVLMEEEFSDWTNVGIALQAYLTSAKEDLKQLLTWVKKRDASIHVRLVRGAYWDEEVIKALQHDWSVPVWQGQGLTDRSYEVCLKALFKASPLVTPVVATHNLRSICMALALAGKYDLDTTAFEIQSIWSMGGQIIPALAEAGYRVGVYAPFGELLPGMAYLVRRLLENSSSQQALELFQGKLPSLDAVKRRPRKKVVSIRNPATTYINTPHFRFVEQAERYAFSGALNKVATKLWRTYPLIINGESVETTNFLESFNPANPTELVGKVCRAAVEEAELAITAAKNAYPEWQNLGFKQRAKILCKTADALEKKRAEFAAWEIMEAGKNWQEADADVTEAIDFLRYYARLGNSYAKGYQQDTPGQTNQTTYRGRGVAAIISPWNFPLAITVGMTAAALVTGNTCILKPSSSTPVVAAQFVALMHELGLPPGVLNFLPGKGSTVGDRLVNHPGVNTIAFTGSHKVGLEIIQASANNASKYSALKRVITEMGGKNAIIVDEDADLEEAVSGIIQSAFSYQGQKCSACSRVIVVGEIHDKLVKLLCEAAESLRVGSPQDPGAEFGPVIDLQAKERIEKIIIEGAKTATLRWRGDSASLGHYVPPAIFTNVLPNSALAQDEIFGPVLSVIKVSNFNEAIKLANSTKYALTGGLYSRHPEHLIQAQHEFMVGSLYLNRGITSALVGKQPFGGFKLSGSGPKAGGPDYLLPFLEPHTVVENTMRKGATPIT